MKVSSHEILEAGRTQAGMTFDDLWLAYFALGGVAPPAELRAYLLGEPATIDYDVVAQAINERFIDLGQNHPMPYLDELCVES